ncbi:RteC domain-containing protein [Bacteroidales bacterium OttesenSCG-928-A17]|nr:RteC domain-containing protein [Bacteroidales bacterium OttesenSCG-928-A17]
MVEHFSKLLEPIQVKLGSIDLEGCDISIEESVEMINFLENCLFEIRADFLSLKNISAKDEIQFFKYIKPEILGFLLYFNKIHRIELKCPNGSNDTLVEYYQKELDSLTYFFEHNLDFYQYYRSKSTHLDEHYFTRNKRSLQLCLDSVHFVMDSSFSTGYDFKVAKIISNEMLRIYLNKKMHGLNKQQFIDNKRAAISIGDLKWTGPKVALVEVGYSFEASKYVNRGNADIKEIMLAFEIIFNVDLGEYYRSYISIKDRAERTKYLNILIDRLLKRMEEDDSK